MTANATGADSLIDISKSYDDWGSTSTVTAATESASSISDSGAAADASNLWTELFAALDPGSAAADSTNFVTDLASLF